MVSLASLLRVVLSSSFLFSNISLTSVYPSSTEWKQAAIVPVFKKGNSNYRPISILNNFSKLFELVVQDHISHYFKFKLNACQHGFTKSKSTITNFVTYLEFITPLIASQGQADAIYLDLSSAFDLVPHTPPLQKLSAFGLSDGYVNWFCSYSTNRKSQVRVSFFGFCYAVWCSAGICLGASAFQYIH
jgi:hypothetical protein